MEYFVGFRCDSNTKFKEFIEHWNRVPCMVRFHKLPEKAYNGDLEKLIINFQSVPPNYFIGSRIRVLPENKTIEAVISLEWNQVEQFVTDQEFIEYMCECLFNDFKALILKTNIENMDAEELVSKIIADFKHVKLDSKSMIIY